MIGERQPEMELLEVVALQRLILRAVYFFEKPWQLVNTNICLATKEVYTPKVKVYEAVYMEFITPAMKKFHFGVHCRCGSRKIFDCLANGRGPQMTHAQ